MYMLADIITKRMKSNQKDVIFIAAALAAALVLGLFFWIRGGESKADIGGGVLEMTIDGALYGSYPLHKEQEIDVASSYGRNTVVIKEGSAYVTEADCPDKICVGMPKIAQEGEVICCLPHRLFLTVKNLQR